MVARTIRLFDDVDENRLDPIWRLPDTVGDAETVPMNRKDAQRWKTLEQRARERGWTIDLLEVAADRAGMQVGGTLTRKLEFALMELSGDERALMKGDLDSIEAFLQSSKPQDGRTSFFGAF
jgi:hypothetical protein